MAARPEGWPAALAVRGDGAGLELDGCDLEALARDHGTPLWAISRSTLEHNFTSLRDAFARRSERCELAYAIKAHNTMAVIAVLHRLGAKADCSAEYEFELALRAGVPPEDVILNGNGKSRAALAAAVRLGVRQVNVDSVAEVRLLEAAAAAAGRRVRCCVRIQLGYARLLELDPSFASTLRIGEGKFGSNVPSGDAFRTVEAVLAAEHLDLVGLSHHVGFSGYMGEYTAEREVMHHVECTREVCEVANEVRRRFGVAVERLDLGGGFRAGGRVLLSTPGAGADVAYHDLPEADDYADAIFGALERHLDAPEQPLVQFETGGGVVADAVVLLARVSEVKDVTAPERRRYVTIDASMMMFVSRGMMRVGHPVVVVDRPHAAPDADVPVEVVGQTCVYDSVAEDIRLAPVESDELVLLLGQGAYCETQSTQFNGFPRPAVVLAAGGEAEVVKRRETFDEVCARDLLPAGLGRPS